MSDSLSSNGVIIQGKEKDLGGFKVRRVLPSSKGRSVGPFVFFDHMGPADFEPGKGIDVRPHPHISLSTITYLFSGVIRHRDSLGVDQEIRPGDVNWMTAGSGIVHSERSPVKERREGHRLEGLQIWVALPRDQEDCSPSFAHHSESDLPTLEVGGCQIRVIAGEAFGKKSPAPTLSPLCYFEVKHGSARSLELPLEYSEMAVYLIAGSVSVGAQRLEAGEMLLIKAKGAQEISSSGPAHYVVIGGEPFPEERHLWWNFVSSSKDSLERAKQAWKAGEFPKVEGDEEFIPLPE